LARPRAADDFAAIRARLEELRRDRAAVLAGDEARPEVRRRSVALDGGGRGMTDRLPLPSPTLPVAGRRSSR
jgi:hypothetical protein